MVDVKSLSNNLRRRIFAVENFSSQFTGEPQIRLTSVSRWDGSKVTTPCQHEFCFRCLEGKNSILKLDPIQCPSCSAMMNEFTPKTRSGSRILYFLLSSPLIFSFIKAFLIRNSKVVQREFPYLFIVLRLKKSFDIVLYCCGHFEQIFYCI